MRYLFADELPAKASELARECPAVEVTDIGAGALAGRMPVLRVGSGPVVIAVKGNAHADEPAGTVTCFELARWMASESVGQEWSDRITLHLIPSANPLGLERNHGWMASASPDLAIWLREVHRDPPAEDREFGYGDTPEQAAHPENAAWHRYLADLPRLDGYVSLHSMAFAGGAWFLAMLDDLERRQPLLGSLATVARAAGLPLHDEDRGGRKGFTRIAPGFCSAPTREGMAAFFKAAGDPEAASWLKLNSMQVAQRLHGTPVALVSELPQWWAADLADMTPLDRSRADVDRSIGQRVAATVPELDAILASAEAGTEHLAATERRDHRLAAAQSLQRLADDWRDCPAASRDAVAGDVHVLRASAENAVLGLRLATTPSAGERWQSELRERAEELAARLPWQALPLSSQVAIQRQMVMALAAHLTGEPG